MGDELTYLRAIARQTNKYASVIEAAAAKVTSQYSGYPANNDLAAQLKTVARLIAGGLKTRVYMVSTGGFDTHGGQVQSGDTTTGNHANLLGGLSDAITAFMKDCQGLGIDKQVLGMTFSGIRPAYRIERCSFWHRPRGGATRIYFRRFRTDRRIGKYPDPFGFECRERCRHAV